MINLFYAHRFSFITLVFFSIFFWFFGPFITFHHTIFFESAGKRIYTILILFLLWALKLFFLDSIPDKKMIFSLQATSEALKKIHALQGRFKGAIRFLKKTFIHIQDTQINLYQLPWYFLIGPTGSGKTSLLMQSDVHFVLAKQNQSTVSSDFCDWWATRSAVFVDIPGNYLGMSSSKKNGRASLHRMLWQCLLNLTIQYRKKRGLNGVIVALNLPELFKHPLDQSQMIDNIKRTIGELQNKFSKALPFYFILTKCDFIPGFTEFFNDSSQEELAQIWGFPLPNVNPREKIKNRLANRFNGLIKRINQQLIWRLNQEKDPRAKCYIKDFPLQIERLKEMVIQFVKTLDIADLSLKGVYLTSSLQQPQDHGSALSPMMSHMPFLPAPKNISQPYFIKQFILQGLMQDRPLFFDNKKEEWVRGAVYSSAVVTMVAAAIFLGRDFQQSVQKTVAMQNAISQYPFSLQNNPNENRLNTILPLLNELKEKTDDSTFASLPFLNHFHFYETKSHHAAMVLYQNALQILLIPAIQTCFENYLKGEHNNVDQLYAVLKAYLMLNDPDHRDISFVLHTLYTLQKYPSALNQHLAMALAQHTKSVALNSMLISDARKTLFNLPPLDLSNIILENSKMNDDEKTIHLGENALVFVSHAIANQIPAMFTVNAFDAIVSEEIPIAAKESIQGNSVLGEIDSTKINNAEVIPALAEQLRTQYIAHYVDVWESLLANMQLATPKNLSETDRMITIMMSDHSPLLELLKTIRQNTAFNPILSQSSTLQALNVLLTDTNNPDNTLYKIFVDLKKLHVFLNQKPMPQHLSEPPESIIALQQIANQSSEPLKTWLISFTNETWGFLKKA